MASIRLKRYAPSSSLAPAGRVADRGRTPVTRTGQWLGFVVFALIVGILLAGALAALLAAVTKTCCIT